METFPHNMCKERFLKYHPKFSKTSKSNLQFFGSFFQFRQSFKTELLFCRGEKSHATVRKL